MGWFWMRKTSRWVTLGIVARLIQCCKCRRRCRTMGHGGCISTHRSTGIFSTLKQEVIILRRAIISRGRLIRCYRRRRSPKQRTCWLGQMTTKSDRGASISWTRLILPSQLYCVRYTRLRHKRLSRNAPSSPTADPPRKHRLEGCFGTKWLVLPYHLCEYFLAVTESHDGAELDRQRSAIAHHTQQHEELANVTVRQP